jgi:hypothetical protein
MAFLAPSGLDAPSGLRVQRQGVQRQAASVESTLKHYARGCGRELVAEVCSLFGFCEEVVRTLSDGLDMPKALPI